MSIRRISKRSCAKSRTCAIAWSWDSSAMATPNLAPFCFCAISGRSRGQAARSWSAPTCASRPSSKCATGWSGRKQIFRARQRKSRCLAQIRALAESAFRRRQGAQPNAAARHRVDDFGICFARVARGLQSATDGSEPQKLQLSSIERVELLSALEDRYQVDLSENEFAKRRNSAGSRKHPRNARPAHAPVSHYPRWAQSWPVRIVRALVFNLLARPAMLLLGWPRITGTRKSSGIERTCSGCRQSHRIFRSRLRP